MVKPKRNGGDAAEAEYTRLIDAKVKKTEKFLEKVEQENKRIDDHISSKGTNAKEREKFVLSKEKLIKQLDKLKKEGTDKFGNLYLKESSRWGVSKYGDGWNILHPTAYKDPYFNAEINKLDPLYDKIKNLLDNFGEWEVSGGRINPIPSVPFDGVETEVGQPRQLRNRPLDALPPFAVPTIVPTIVPDTALPDDRRRRVIIPFPDFDDIPDGGINMDNIEGGRRCPMEDHFFFPARDRDRRYDTVDYSRVVPHHRGFGMTNIF